MANDVDINELKKISVNKILYSGYKIDHFEIDTVLNIIDSDTLPVDIPLNNNQVFIRDLTTYIVENNIEVKEPIKLEPNIIEQ